MVSISSYLVIQTTRPTILHAVYLNAVQINLIGQSYERNSEGNKHTKESPQRLTLPVSVMKYSPLNKKRGVRQRNTGVGRSYFRFGVQRPEEQRLART